MKKKLKPHHWFCDVWSYSVWFFVGWSFEEFTAAFEKQFQSRPPGSSANREGSTLHAPEHATVVVWTRDLSPAVLAHECLHAANFILGSAGHKVTTDNDEAQAYLLDTLVRRALKLDVK